MSVIRFFRIKIFLILIGGLLTWPVYGQDLNGDDIQMDDVRSLLRQNKVDEASQMADRLIRLNPRDPNPYLLRGQIEMMKGNPKLAVTDFEKAVFIEAHDPLAGGMLARAYGMTGRYEEGLRQIESTLAANPDSPLLLMTKADLLVRSGKVAETIEILQTALEFTDNPELQGHIRHKLAQAYAHTEDWVSAERVISTAYDQSGNPEFLLLRANIRNQAENPAGALKDLEELQKLPGIRDNTGLSERIHLQIRNLRHRIQEGETRTKNLASFLKDGVLFEEEPVKFDPFSNPPPGWWRSLKAGDKAVFKMSLGITELEMIIEIDNIRDNIVTYTTSSTFKGGEPIPGQTVEFDATGMDGDGQLTEVPEGSKILAGPQTYHKVGDKEIPCTLYKTEIAGTTMVMCHSRQMPPVFSGGNIYTHTKQEDAITVIELKEYTGELLPESFLPI